MVKPGILIVAEDAALRATLARWLLQAGYAVELAESPRRAHEVISKTSIAVAIVAPQGLGAVGVELRGAVEHAILIGESTDNAGAPGEPSDVRISLPLNELDVLAKIRSVLGPAPIPEARPGPQLLRFEGFALDAGARTCVDAKGQELTLTRAEFSLLLAFGQKPGQVLSRDELTRVVAGRGAEPEDRSVDVLISRLRRKIEPDPKTPRLIVTVPGEGYRFTAKPQAIVATNEATQAPGTELRTAGAPVPSLDRQRPNPAFRIFALAAALVGILVMTVVGWKEWSNRAALQQTAEAPSQTASPELPSSSKPVQSAASRDEQRATVYKRMITALQDNQFTWRTIERLAIMSGVDENEAHEILAEHPGEVVLGKSQDGKLIAKLSGR